MDRLRLVRMLALSEIGDDYETLAKVRDEVIALCGRIGISVNPDEISDALFYLIGAGLAKAFRLSPWSPAEEIPGTLVPQLMNDLYFTATKEGLTELKEFQWPPGI